MTHNAIVNSPGFTTPIRHKHGTSYDGTAALNNFTATGGTATIEWSAVPGKRYRVQFKDTVSDVVWQNLAGDVTAGAATATKADTGITGRQERYYRVILAP